jgi:hypothetical protein
LRRLLPQSEVFLYFFAKSINEKKRRRRRKLFPLLNIFSVVVSDFYRGEKSCRDSAEHLCVNSFAPDLCGEGFLMK